MIWKRREVTATAESDLEAARQASDPALVVAIRAAIDATGRITFARFMELALYHPEHGYYLQRDARPGRGGDYLTAPELSSFFGQCLARQLHEIWRLLDRPRPFTVLECGAGNGRLAHDILSAARAGWPDFFAALRYFAQEVNPHRRADAAALLTVAGFGERSSVAGTIDTTPFTGVVLTNEFLDALPVHRVVGDASGTLLERWVRWDSALGWFAEEVDAPATPALAAALAEGGVTLAEGQSAEICLALLPWLAQVTTSLARGCLLTIDYGYPTAELYAPARRAGTFLCYYQQTANEEPYLRIGQQDMTAHVDFGALQRRGERLGLRTLGLSTQAEVLTNLGLGDLLVASQQPDRELGAYLADRSAVLALIDPGGLGNFRVLAQAKDLPATTALVGFAPLR